MPPQLGWPEETGLILITHGHDDHLDTRIIDFIRRKQPKVIANPLVRWYLIEQGVPAHTFIGMNIGGTVSLLDMKVTMTAGFHMAHIDLGNGKVGLPHLSVGFVLGCSEGTNVYFSGDTSVFSDMQRIGRLYKPDIAVLPIGNRFTMGPEEAAEAIRLLNVKQVIPCHYGTMASLTGTRKSWKSSQKTSTACRYMC